MASKSPPLDLVGRIYDAATAPEQWPLVLEQLSDLVRGDGIAVYVPDFGDSGEPLMLGARLNPEKLDDYVAHYRTCDPWLEGGVNLPIGAVITGGMLVPMDVFDRSEFYNEFIAPQDIYHILSACIFKAKSDWGYLTITRPHRKGGFGEDAQELLGHFAPHIQRALQISRRLADLEEDLGARAAVIDLLPVGVIFLDEAGRIVSMNRSAEALVRKRDGLCVTHTKLCAETAVETAAMRRLLSSAIHIGREPSMHRGGCLSLSRSSGKRPLSAMICPLGRARRFALGARRTVAVMLISDPERTAAPPHAALAAAYGLTPKEAMLAAALASGQTLKRYAEHAGVSMNTVRWTLKQVFHKTDTRRQTELVRLLAGISSIMPSD